MAARRRRGSGHVAVASGAADIFGQWPELEDVGAVQFLLRSSGPVRSRPPNPGVPDLAQRVSARRRGAAPCLHQTLPDAHAPRTCRRAEAWLLVRSLLVLAGLPAGGAVIWILIHKAQPLWWNVGWQIGYGQAVL